MLKPFVAVAALGLVLSIVVHGFALLGLPPRRGGMILALQLGIFVVSVPAVFLSQPFKLGGKYFRIRDRWRRGLLRGCPSWMRHMMQGFSVYAIINFVIFMVSVPSGRVTAPEFERMFSGHLMAFYSVALGVIWSAMVTARNAQRRCTAGHLVFSDADNYCEICRRPILDPPVPEPKFADSGT